MADPIQNLKNTALAVQAEAEKFLRQLLDKYPDGRFAFMAEIESEVGVAPVTASAGIPLTPTFCRMLTTAAAERLALLEQDLIRKAQAQSLIGRNN